ncbi:MAG TPA: hypothetical protein VKY27_12050 [Bacteriovoracaceae bacterium]|nr:hypothetical protein [Bacteriovoracaceae bacterium]
MAYLFVDSTYDLTLGLLKDNFSWAKYVHFPNQKASEILQIEVLKMCSEFNVEVPNLTSVIHIAGPGFYTGLRLSEGFVDVLKFSGIKSYSYYTYDILPLLGVNSGLWITKAYRGEYFIHDLSNKENSLIPSSRLKEVIVDKSPFYIHSDKAIDDLGRECIIDPISTSDLLEKNPQVFKEIIQQNFQRESYYFRAPEDEFRTSI